MHDSGQKMIRARTWTHNSCTLCQLVCCSSSCPTNKSIHSVVFQVLTPCSSQVCRRWRFGGTCQPLPLERRNWVYSNVEMTRVTMYCNYAGTLQGMWPVRTPERTKGQTLLSGPTATAKVTAPGCRTHHLLQIFSPLHDSHCPHLLQPARTIAPHPHSNHFSVTFDPIPSQHTTKSARYPKTLTSKYVTA